MEDNQQELMYKLQMFEQQMQYLQQQLQAVEQGIKDLNTIKLSLDELTGKKDSEILSPLGKGIYAKTKLISEDLIVDIGSKNFVKKNIPDTKKIIDEQLEKLEEVKVELKANMEKGSQEFQQMLMEAQGEHQCCGKHDSCECEEEGKCEDKECACEKGKK